MTHETLEAHINRVLIIVPKILFPIGYWNLTNGVAKSKKTRTEKLRYATFWRRAFKFFVVRIKSCTLCPMKEEILHKLLV